MPAMTSRYDQPYAAYKDIGKVAGPSKAERDGRAKASQRGDFLKMLASLAPTVGGLAGAGIGTLIAPGVGTAAGGAIGGQLGNLAGAGLGYAGGEQTREFDDKESERSAKLQALMSVMGGRR